MHRVPNKKDPRHTKDIIKMAKVEYKKKILKAARGKQTVTYN